TASFPFDKPGADLILRSSDRVDFRVRSHILLEASSFFETMLSLPQPPSGPSQTDERPIIELAEDSVVLEALLRICYPIEKEDSHRTLAEVEPILRAALKYDMALPIGVLKKELVSAVAGAPVQTWAVACRLGLESVARLAADTTLAITSLDVSPDDLAGISAGDYFRLREFHRLGGQVESGFRPLDPPSAPRSSSPHSPVSPHDFLYDMPFPDLICRSSDGREYQCHRGVLSVASPVLHEQIKAMTPRDMPSVGNADPPILQLEESGMILAALLRMCYAGASAGDEPVFDLDYEAIFRAAEKYGMEGVQRQIRQQWRDCATASPLRAYLAAIRLGWKEEAKQAARYTLPDSLNALYIPELETTTALVYYRLIRYHEMC
ncbi:hypothetical protein C8Q76DRAFT_568430, partial [Earliella scabrosa]